MNRSTPTLTASGPHRARLAALAGAMITFAQLTASLYAGQTNPRALLEVCDAPSDASLVAKIRSIPTWFLPAKAIHIAGPVYSVGTKGLGVWLIRTDDGDILLNTGFPHSGPLIVRSIQKHLDKTWDPSRLKILLAGHAHIDHVGALAWFQENSPASVAIMDREVPLLASGGQSDFSRLTKNVPYRGVKADRVLLDGEKITHGGVTLTARRTPGHTLGATTFVLHCEEAGRPLTIVFPDGTGINPGTKFGKHASYEGIRADYERTFGILAELKPDIWLPAHLELCDFENKRKRAAAATNPGDRLDAWIDPAGYKAFLCRQHQEFETHLQREKLAATQTPPTL